MNKFKLFSAELIFAIVLGFLTSYMYLQDIQFFENMNKKFTDMFFQLRGEKPASQDIVIVDIDEKSLSELGQWPWSRNKIATILSNLASANVAIIGLDIVFAEADNSSPKRVLEKLGITHLGAKDYDSILAETLKKTPTILGYIFDFEEAIQKGLTPNISTVILEKNFNNVEFLPKAKGVIANIPMLQQRSMSSGFFNTLPDYDGIVRSVPLLVKYKDNIFPSLALEVSRLIQKSDTIAINYTKAGIKTIDIGELSIPTDRFGRLWVNYKGERMQYRYISAVNIHNNTFLKRDIENKIVLIGTSSAGLLDLRATPFDSVFPGVEIHATAIDNILNQNFVSYASWVEAFNVASIIFLLLLTTLFFLFFNAIKTAFLYILTICGFMSLSFYFFTEEGIILNIVYPLLSSILLYMILASLHFFLESKKKELIRNKFSKKVSSAVADTLIKKGDKDILEAKKKEVTVFFSDIRGFTSMSENFKDPKQLIEFLNLYMTPMAKIIIKNGGTIDKFIGDSIMAYWNAPLDTKNHADMAVKSALQQIKELNKLNISLKKKNFPSIEIGIGINSGMVVVGEMGSEDRSDYTIIGDSVNLGTRLEGLCKTYDAKIIISEFTKRRLNEKYDIRFLDKVQVKGKSESVNIYKVLS